FLFCALAWAGSVTADRWQGTIPPAPRPTARPGAASSQPCRALARCGSCADHPFPAPLVSAQCHTTLSVIWEATPPTAMRFRPHPPAARAEQGGRGDRSAPVPLLAQTAEAVEQRLGIAVRLARAFEDEGTGRLEGERSLEIGRHRAIGRVSGVLPVDHHGEPLQRLHHLIARDDAVAQPVGE